MRLRVGPSVFQIKKSSALLGAAVLISSFSILYLVMGSEEASPAATKQVFHIDKDDLNALEERLQKLEYELQRNRDMLGQIRETVQALLKGDYSAGEPSFDFSRLKSLYHSPNRTYVMLSSEDCTFQNSPAADVDVNLLDVYDTLKFDNPDGGVWKQGWKIEYDASQWSPVKKLKVFVVPHSHNDPGWLKTFEKYFNDQTRHILNNIATKMKEDVRRKFIWAEVSYLAMWWEIAEKEARNQVKRLLENGQLEIVTGGWVMNDEASTHYYAMIEQLVEGHQWLNMHLGYKPRNGWAIDPFGLSPTMAYLLRRMGLENMVIQRVHYAIKKYLAQHKSLEFLWRQHWDQNHTTDILCHMMPFYSYDVPHSCGPDPKICCQFDFKRLPGNKVNCPWRVPPVAITDKNVADRAWLLLDQYRKKAQLFRTDALLIPLGDDFRYDKPIEWEQQFKNYQKLFDFMNSQEEWNVEAKFGTLDDYFQAVRESAARESSLSLPVAFPSLSGDFFTYADRDDHYWSGYFTSRPFYKNMDRTFEAHLRAAEILFSIMWSSMGRSKINQPDFVAFLMKNLVESRRNLGLFQHHDAITGTAKDAVVLDYASRMLTSIQKLQKIISHASLFLLSQDNNEHIFITDKNLLQMHEIRRHYTSLPEKIIIRFSPELRVRTLVLFNSLGHSRREMVMLRISSSEVEVRDSSGTIVPAQISPIWAGVQTVDEEFELSFIAELPALSLVTYTLSLAESPKTTFKASVTLYNFNSVPHSRHFHFATAEAPQELSIQSSYLMAVFSGADGMLRRIVNKEDGLSTEIRIQFLMYGTRAKGRDRSGAYLFLPDTDAQNVKYSQPRIRIVVGPVYSDLTVFLPNIKHRVILRNSPGLDGAGLDIENIVDISKEVNRELIMRFYTNITGSHQEFFTDLNGFQIIKRTTMEKIPIQGNVYPMPTLAYLQDNTSRLTLLTGQPLGVASLKPGWIEVFLDRRLNQDDNRGLQQGVTDNKQTAEVFRLLVERPWSGFSGSRSSPSQPSLVVHHSLLSLLHPVFSMFKLDPNIDTNQGALAFDTSLQASYSPLGMELPCDVHLVNLRTLQSPPIGSHSFWPSNSSALFLHRLGMDCTYKTWTMKCPTETTQISIGKLFPQHFGQLVEETSLSLMYPGNNFSREREFHLPPMEIVAFKLSDR